MNANHLGGRMQGVNLQQMSQPSHTRPKPPFVQIDYLKTLLRKHAAVARRTLLSYPCVASQTSCLTPTYPMLFTYLSYLPCPLLLPRHPQWRGH